MRKDTNEIDIIHSLIEKHIKNLKMENVSKQDKEIDYLLIQEAVEAIVREYELSDDSRQRKNTKKIMIEVYNQIYTYLINNNKYDYRMLELYAMLDSFVNN